MNIEQQIQNINIELIIPNRFQPRLSFDEKSLNELAASIKEHGIIQPLVVRKIGEKYEIVAGERRYKAATIAGLTEVPAIVATIDDNKSAEIAVIENIQRKNLNSLEEAKSYKKILDRGNLTQEELAKKMGITQATIANKLRLLNLATEVQEALMNDRISERHARSLLQLPQEEQLKMLQEIIDKRLTVRQLDDEIKNILTPGEEISLNDEQSVAEPVSAPQEETLNIDVNKIAESAKDIIPKSPKNILNLFDQESYPSLEDEKANMNVEPVESLEEENLLNPTNEMDTNVTHIKEEKNIFDEDLEEPVSNPTETKEEVSKPIEDKSKIKPNDMPSVINAYRDIKDQITEAGYQINTEEFDFEDLYQIIIKIDKQV